MPLRIIFCGTPEFAVPSLRHLIDQPGFKIEAVVTQPDRPRGRGQEVAISPVKQAAIEAGLAIFQPQKMRGPEALEFFSNAAPDAIIIIAYGQIVPQRLIDIPRLGWINLHGSLLPKYRGAAPIQWAIANGEEMTGLTTMKIDAGLDTGPMLLKYETPIGADETAPQLSARLAEAGASLVAETLRRLDSKEIAPEPQDNSQTSLAPPLKKEDGRIDWSLSAQEIYNHMRGFDPWPGAFTTFRAKTCHVWGKPAPREFAAASLETGAPGVIVTRDGKVFISCGERTAFHAEFVQVEGRKRVTAGEFANGARLVPGDRFDH
jgi:methionyl-tRNA formyltransferase